MACPEHFYWSAACSAWEVKPHVGTEVEKLSAIFCGIDWAEGHYDVALRGGPADAQPAERAPIPGCVRAARPAHGLVAWRARVCSNGTCR